MYFLERYIVIFTRLEIVFAIGGENVRNCDYFFVHYIVDNIVGLCVWIMTMHAFLLIMYHFWPTITIASANWTHFFSSSGAANSVPMSSANKGLCVSIFNILTNYVIDI